MKKRYSTEHTEKRTSSSKRPQANTQPPAPRRKKKRRRRKSSPLKSVLQGIFLGLCICLFLFSVWKLASIFMGYHSGEKEYDDLRQYVLSEPADAENTTTADDTTENTEGEEDTAAATSSRMERIDLASLKAINAEAVGWIEIPGTEISYPLVHTSDNTYYLTHTFKRQENKSGSIFIETSNAANFTDLHTIIYGHNMKDGSMFAGLKNYEKKNYYEAHPYVYVDLDDGTHCYQIFSCHQADITDISYTIGYAADDTYASFLDSLKTSSLYDTGVSVDTEDSVITLSTCTNKGEKRFVVHAKKLY